MEKLGETAAESTPAPETRLAARRLTKAPNSAFGHNGNNRLVPYPERALNVYNE